MNFMQLLQSLDEMLYEVMSWLVFFPITLWRTVSHPLRMMEYAGSELHDRPDQQYEDTLSPPQFLLIALLVSHAVGLTFGEGTNPIVASNAGLAAYIDTDSKLLVLRLAFFSILPLVLATAMLVGSKRQITRQLLKAPFYAQCYPAGAFALALGIGTLLTLHASGPRMMAGSTIMIVAMAVYFAVQVAWFHRHLKRGILVGFSYAVASLIGGMIVGILLAMSLV